MRLILPLCLCALVNKTKLCLVQLTFAFIFLFATEVRAQYKIEVLDSNTFHLGEGVILSKTSFRGLSVVDDNTIWVSGSKGTIARSIDGGKTFNFQQLKGYEKSDFRDIEAFDDKRAIIMSSGTPAYILKTIDGGQTWKEAYKNTDTAYFLDAMDFWDYKRGMLVGDPINGHFLLLQTNDGGETWQQLDTSKTPKAMEGEAVFAASGTSLRCWGLNSFGIVYSCKSTSHLCLFGTELGNMKYDPCPELEMQKGSKSKGAFSFAKYEEGFAVVGGDYAVDTIKSLTSQFILQNHYPYWLYAKNYTFGYRSCIEVIAETENKLIACGPSGVDIFERPLWMNISKISFHVVRKAKIGKAVFLAGPKGKIGKLIY